MNHVKWIFWDKEIMYYLPSFEDLRRWIVKKRDQLGWTQKRLAHMAKIKRATLAKIESGLHKNYEHIAAVVEVLRQELTTRRIGDKVRMITAKDIMATPVETVNEDETLQKVWEKMEKMTFSQFPVKSHGKEIVGSITERGINKTLMQYGDKARDMKVKEVMEEPFPIISPSTPLPPIIYLLQYYQAVLVSREGEVIGIITNTDVGKALVLK